MKDDIKEILRDLEFASGVFDYTITPDRCTFLKDYITNLQEQYEKADNDRHKLFEQKEKAIEYGKNCLELLKDVKHYECESIDIVALLKMIHSNYIDILQGEDNDKD